MCLDGDNPDILAHLFLGDTDDQELVDSALLEAGNIIVSWLINGIADRGGWKIAVTPPALARDMPRSLGEHHLGGGQCGKRGAFWPSVSASKPATAD